MEDKEVKMETVSVNDAVTETPDNTPADNTEVAELTEKLAELNDKYLRVAAELENTRRRAALDAEKYLKK